MSLVSMMAGSGLSIGIDQTLDGCVAAFDGLFAFRRAALGGGGFEPAVGPGV